MDSDCTWKVKDECCKKAWQRLGRRGAFQSVSMRSQRCNVGNHTNPKLYRSLTRSRSKERRLTSRPAARLRSSACSRSVALHTQWFRTGQRLMEIRRKPQGQLCLRVVVRLAFSQAHLHLQKHMLLEGRGFGALDICAAGAEGLLVMYIAASRVCCWESLGSQTTCMDILLRRSGYSVGPSVAQDA